MDIVYNYPREEVVVFDRLSDIGFWMYRNFKSNCLLAAFVKKEIW